MLDADVEVDRRDFPVRAAITVAAGERLALFGPSGAGKTTLLETIAGLVVPRRGRVALAGQVLTSTSQPRVAVPPWRRQVGLLRQDPGLFPHMSVRANLGYARTAGPPAGELAEVAAALGIGALLDAMPARLSGGQRHRVALGRLLLARCRTLLLDEPFSGLDAALRRSLTGLVTATVADRRLPAVLVAHELADAQAFADRMAVLDAGQILQAGRPDEVVLRPASRRVAELVGYLGFVPLAHGLAGVHPDRVVAGSAPSLGLVLRGSVLASRPSGAGWEVDLDIAGSSVTCRLTDRPAGVRLGDRPAGGELVVTVLDPPLFGRDGRAVAQASRGEPAVLACSAGDDPP